MRFTTLMTCALALSFSTTSLFAENTDEFNLDFDANAASSFKQNRNKKSYYASFQGSVAYLKESEIREVNNLPMPDNTISMNNAAGLGIAVGVRKGFLRGELESTSQYFTVDDDLEGINIEADTIVSTLMINGYIDAPISEKADLFFGAGIGAAAYYFDYEATNSTSKVEDSDTDLVFAYQLTAGVSFDIANNLELYTGYRFFTTANPNFDGIDLSAPQFHTGFVGIRKTF